MSDTRMFTVRLEAEIADAMDALQKRDGIPYSEQLRRALRPFLAERGVLKVEEPKKADRKRVGARKRP
jgi:hypothetical protein